jgi:hypothetical protein
MPEAMTIEEMESWTEAEWRSWLKTAVTSYLMAHRAEANVLALLPFVINRDESPAVQIHSQLMMYAPRTVPRAGAASSFTAATWAAEDGVNSLCHMIALAGLCSAKDLHETLFIVETKLRNDLDQWYLDRFYAAISDYAFDRMSPNEVVEFAEYVRKRRDVRTPWSFVCRAIVRGLAVDGTKKLPELIERLIPRFDLKPGEDARLKYLQQIISEYRPLDWPNAAFSNVDPWTKTVVEELAFYAVDVRPSNLNEEDREEGDDILDPASFRDQWALILNKRARLIERPGYQLYREMRTDLYESGVQ